MALALVDAQAAGEPASRKTVREDRHDDDAERQRDQRLGILDPVIDETDCEQAGDRHRDDAARRDPADENPLAPRHVGEHEAGEDGERPDDEQEEEQESDEAPLELADGLPIERRR